MVVLLVSSLRRLCGFGAASVAGPGVWLWALMFQHRCVLAVPWWHCWDAPSHLPAEEMRRR